ncbi:type II toxin-antitoxin system VapC family toxin [Achromobacter spanius]|uniref:Ribonuclease VapC n=1 Tax=Achromobacter spanius TaxID=217203 RepID=A0AAW3I6J8_9BURK|nr:type II toxin-antitoxin system VapC family toxin [Achromobacter spanius]KNE28384.1 DNA-binding protein [Achromobacter spanius]
MITVLDASVALAWLADRTDVTEAMLARHLFEEVDHFDLLVPQHWRVEVANGMLRLQRAQLVSPAKVTLFANQIEALAIESDRARIPHRWAHIRLIALTHALTAYDAAYVELAMRSGGRLATFDRKLADAASACGIPIFGQAHGIAEPMAAYG